MDWTVFLYASLAVVGIFAVIAIIYYISTAKRIKKQHARYEELLASLKPGVEVIFVGGLIGTIQSIDDSRTFATIKVGTTTVKATLYSIASVIEK